MTEDELPFIRAILSNREDMVARLAYADWLEERGDPRGAYLRRWVAANSTGTMDEGWNEQRSLLWEQRNRINRHWASLVEDWLPPDSDLSRVRHTELAKSDAVLGYGPCIVCGRAGHAAGCVSRLPCQDCGRVLCWQCADTGVHGSLPDFERFVTGDYRLPWDSCPFCQEVDWMRKRGG